MRSLFVQQKPPAWLSNEKCRVSLQIAGYFTIFALQSGIMLSRLLQTITFAESNSFLQGDKIL